MTTFSVKLALSLSHCVRPPIPWLNDSVVPLRFVRTPSHGNFNGAAGLQPQINRAQHVTWLEHTRQLNEANEASNNPVHTAAAFQPTMCSLQHAPIIHPGKFSLRQSTKIELRCTNGLTCTVQHTACIDNECRAAGGKSLDWLCRRVLQATSPK